MIYIFFKNKFKIIIVIFTILIVIETMRVNVSRHMFDVKISVLSVCIVPYLL